MIIDVLEWMMRVVGLGWWFTVEGGFLSLEAGNRWRSCCAGVMSVGGLLMLLPGADDSIRGGWKGDRGWIRNEDPRTGLLLCDDGR